MRITVLQLLRDEQSILGDILQQPSYLLHLFTSFGDGCWKVVKIAFQLVGKLGSRKPGSETAQPMLEAVLDQLLVQLEICPGDEFKEGKEWCCPLISHQTTRTNQSTLHSICAESVQVLQPRTPQ